MPARPLTLYEGAPPIEVKLEDGQATALESAPAVTLVRTRNPRWYLLSSAGKVGVLSVDDLEIVILPKVPISRIVFLLGYAKAPDFWTDDLVHVDGDEDLVEALVNSFVRFASRAVEQGVLQGYVTVEDVAPVLRGRIRENDQIRRVYGRSIPLHVRYDDYSVDIPENQILLAAVHTTLRLPVVTPAQRRVLHRLTLALEAVTPAPRGVRRPDWTPSRLNARFVSALRLAEMILDGESIEQRHGDVELRGFLVNLNKVFEDFVCVALNEALDGRDGRGELQHKTHLDEAQRVEVKPDFVWFDVAETPAAVVDAKYKAEKPSGFPNADVYQMLAYCTTLGLREGHLVYARGEEDPVSHHIPGAEVDVHCHALDLEAAPAEILGAVARLADRILHPATGVTRSG